MTLTQYHWCVMKNNNGPSIDPCGTPHVILSCLMWYCVFDTLISIYSTTWKYFISCVFIYICAYINTVLSIVFFACALPFLCACVCKKAAYFVIYSLFTNFDLPNCIYPAHYTLFPFILLWGNCFVDEIGAHKLSLLTPLPKLRFHVLLWCNNVMYCDSKYFSLYKLVKRCFTIFIYVVISRLYIPHLQKYLFKRKFA